MYFSTENGRTFKLPQNNKYEDVVEEQSYAAFLNATYMLIKNYCRRSFSKKFGTLITRCINIKVIMPTVICYIFMHSIKLNKSLSLIMLIVIMDCTAGLVGRLGMNKCVNHCQTMRWPIAVPFHVCFNN